MNRLFLFLYLFFFAFMGKAQKITLEHSFNSLCSIVTENAENNNLLVNAEKYIIYDKISNQVKIYNLDYSLYKNVNINFPNQYDITSVYLSSIKLFNNDDLIEFAVHLYNSENYQHNTVLYNENGNILKEFKDVTTLMTFTTKTGDIKILTYTTNRGCEIYSLNNSVSSKQKSNINETKSAYPNPAIAKITLPYRLDSGEQTVMHIYSLTGQLLKAIQIDYNFDKIELDVSDFNAGEYIYEYKGISNKFNVK